MHRVEEQSRQRTAAPRRGVLCWSVTGVVLIAAALVLGAGWLPLGEMTPWAQLVAFRPQLGVALLLVALAGLLVRALRPLCIALAILAAVSTGTVLGRFSGDLAASSDPGITVLSSNVRVDGASVEEIVKLAVAGSVDAIVLPEASRRFAARVADGARRRGLDLVSETDEPLNPVTAVPRGTLAYPTSLLVRAELRPRFSAALPGALLGSLTATITVGGRELNLVAVHPPPPFPGQVRQWRADLDRVAKWCAKPAIIAGDLNATLDHPPLRRLLDAGCTDAAALSGNALAGTWHSSWPRWLATPIDHVLLGGRRGSVSSFGLHNITGTDHRAVLATVTP